MYFFFAGQFSLRFGGITYAKTVEKQKASFVSPSTKELKESC